ncbi:MAG: hypothetical protein WKF97_26675 [Chitinophagaceae bacterium]
MKIIFAVFFLLIQAVGWPQAQTAKKSTPVKHGQSNPVLNANFPDPTVIKAAGKYYAYATQGEVNGQRRKKTG